MSPASVVSQTTMSPRQWASTAESRRPIVSSTPPPISGNSRIVSGSSSGASQSGWNVQAEHAAEQHAENGRAEAAGDEQPRERPALAHHEAGDRDHESLADIGEHVAEHQRHRERQQRARVGLVARRHAHRAAEDLERPRPPRVRRAAAAAKRRRRRRVVEDRARARAIERAGKAMARQLAGPARDPAEEVARFQRPHVLQHPLQPRGIAQCRAQVVAIVQRCKLRAQCCVLACEDGQPCRDIRLVVRHVRMQPRRHFVDLPLQRGHLLRERLQFVDGSDRQRMLPAVGRRNGGPAGPAERRARCRAETRTAAHAPADRH